MSRASSSPTDPWLIGFGELVADTGREPPPRAAIRAAPPPDVPRRLRRRRQGAPPRPGRGRAPQARGGPASRANGTSFDVPAPRALADGDAVFFQETVAGRPLNELLTEDHLPRRPAPRRVRAPRAPRAERERRRDRRRAPDASNGSRATSTGSGSSFRRRRRRSSRTRASSRGRRTTQAATEPAFLHGDFRHLNLLARRRPPGGRRLRRRCVRRPLRRDRELPRAARVRLRALPGAAARSSTRQRAAYLAGYEERAGTPLDARRLAGRRVGGRDPRARPPRGPRPRGPATVERVVSLVAELRARMGAR